MSSSASEMEIKKFRLFKDDVIITKDSESPFDIGIASHVVENIEDLICGYHLAIIKPMKPYLYGLFLYFALSCDISAYQFCIAANGVTRFGLSYNAMKNIKVPVPSTSEQERIADFLDQKTTQIDSLIEKKQALIEKLSEKRTAMITRAVTKGLDESVPMKDSGVDWLGAVPKHWEILRLRFVIKSIEQGWSPQCYNYPADDEQWGVMKVGCVNGNRFDASDNKALPEDMEPKTEYELRPGDILISRANTKDLLGSAALIEENVRR